MCIFVQVREDAGLPPVTAVTVRSLMAADGPAAERTPSRSIPCSAQWPPGAETPPLAGGFRLGEHGSPRFPSTRPITLSELPETEAFRAQARAWITLR